MAVVSGGGSSSESGGRISLTADIASLRTTKGAEAVAAASLCDDEDAYEERSVTIDYYEDPPDETLRIVLCDGQTVAIQRQEDAAFEEDDDDLRDSEAAHEGIILGDGSGAGSNSASNSDENGDVKVFKVLVREEDRDGQRSRRGHYEDHSLLRRSSSVVTFSDEQNNRSYGFMDEPLVERGDRRPPLKSALRQNGSTSSSAHHAPPNTGASPGNFHPPGSGEATDGGGGGEADLIFDYVEGDKRRERRRLNSARSKNRLLRKHCSNKDPSVGGVDIVYDMGRNGVVRLHSDAKSVNFLKSQTK